MTPFLLTSALLGLIVGSFINAAVPRLHARDGGFFTGRSRCLICKHDLATEDLIPVVSYLLLRGHCRYCGKPFGLRYLFVELITASTFALVTATLGVGNPAALAWALFISAVLIFIATYDWIYTEIPDEVAIPAALGALALSPFAFTSPDFFDAGIGTLAIGGGFAAVVIFSNGKWLGGGDVRLGALLGALLGLTSSLVAVFFAALVGTLGGITYAVSKYRTFNLTREQILQTSIPFGPALVVGGIVSLLFGNEIVTWYLLTFMPM